ncbi:MAG: HEXXH motif-containing putative peptide modification protein [Polyangia bacterium]
MDLIRANWLEAFRELCLGVSVILPLQSRGLEPHNESVHAMRGLVASSARAGHRAAQTLVHEAGHNKMSSVLDVFTLFHNRDDELCYSPFVGIPRPMAALFHGVFSFLQDMRVTRRLMPQVLKETFAVLGGQSPKAGDTSALAELVPDLDAFLDYAEALTELVLVLFVAALSFGRTLGELERALGAECFSRARPDIRPLRPRKRVGSCAACSFTSSPNTQAG